MDLLLYDNSRERKNEENNDLVEEKDDIYEEEGTKEKEEICGVGTKRKRRERPPHRRSERGKPTREKAFREDGLRKKNLLRHPLKELPSSLSSFRGWKRSLIQGTHAKNKRDANE